MATGIVLHDLNVPDISMPPTEIPEDLQEANFGDSVRYFLKERGINYRQFSGLTGLSESQMSKLLGETRDPGLLSFSRIIGGFGWTIKNWEAQLLFKKATAHLDLNQPYNP